MNFEIDAPRGFDFERTLGSHGWSDLPPFEYVSKSELRRVLDLGRDRAPATITVNGDRAGVRVSASRKLNRGEAARAVRDVRHMLRLDDDMTEFYGALAAEPEFAWVARDGG